MNTVVGAKQKWLWDILYVTRVAEAGREAKTQPWGQGRAS